MSFLKDFWGFMKERKAFWITPIIIVIILIGYLLFVAESSAAGNFIYTLF